jgi:hypothetical protein
MIEKYQVNPAIRNHQVQTPRSRSIKSTLPSGRISRPYNQEVPVFQPYNWEVSGQLYNQEAPSSNPAIKKYRTS